MKDQGRGESFYGMLVEVTTSVVDASTRKDLSIVLNIAIGELEKIGVASSRVFLQARNRC